MEAKRLYAPMAWLVSGLSVGVAAALIRWSFWWPHRDIRQNYAIVGIVVLSAVGVVALLYGMNLASSSRQRLIWGGIAVVLAVLVSAGVFGQLIDATATSR